MSTAEVEYREAITYALDRLGEITTDEFQIGGDVDVREKLAKALGFNSQGHFYSERPAKFHPGRRPR